MKKHIFKRTIVFLLCSLLWSPSFRRIFLFVACSEQSHKNRKSFCRVGLFHLFALPQFWPEKSTLSATPFISSYNCPLSPPFSRSIQSNHTYFSLILISILITAHSFCLISRSIVKKKRFPSHNIYS